MIMPKAARLTSATGQSRLTLSACIGWSARLRPGDHTKNSVRSAVLPQSVRDHRDVLSELAEAYKQINAQR
jgi:hypothetical protein